MRPEAEHEVENEQRSSRKLVEVANEASGKSGKEKRREGIPPFFFAPRDPSVEAYRNGSRSLQSPDCKVFLTVFMKWSASAPSIKR